MSDCEITMSRTRGDGNWLFDFFIAEELDFIVRLVGDRHLLHWNGRRLRTGSVRGRLASRFAVWG